MNLSKYLPSYNYNPEPVLELKWKKKNVEATDTTKETRKESYDIVIESLGERQKAVYKTLKASFPKGATAKELAVEMFVHRLVGSPERNSTHPRLNELVEKGLIRVIGKKTCTYTDRRVAIYQAN